MRVLYVNHTAQTSGAERSLLDLLAALPATVEPVLAAPAGRLTEQARAIGVETIEIAGTDASLRPHLLHTPRALLELVRGSLEVGRAARHVGAELVHANSIRAGIALAGANTASVAKLAHVRDCLPPGALTTASMRLLAARMKTIVANSAYTARFVVRSAPAACVEVVHNPVDMERFDPGAVDRAVVRARLGAAGRRRLLLGVIGQLTPWKGQDIAIQALALLREAGLDAHLLLVGSAKFLSRATRYDNRAYVTRLERLIAERGLGERVSLLGERDDVAALLGALDLLLLPSWEEPFGRVAIEAMAMEIPVIATAVGGPQEIIDNGREGLLVAPRDPSAWASAVSSLADRPALRREMGRAGRQRVEQAFSAQRHAGAILSLYERVLGMAVTRKFTTGSTVNA